LSFFNAKKQNIPQETEMIRAEKRYFLAKLLKIDIKIVFDQMEGKNEI